MRLQEILLIKPTAKFKVAYLAMADEYLANGDPRFNAACANFDAYLAGLANAAQNEIFSIQGVPQTEFWLVSGHYMLGRSRLCHWLAPALVQEKGHIRFDIRPLERNKGYGTLLLKLTLEKASRVGLCRVLLTCAADNFASIKVIEHNGGVLNGRIISLKNRKITLQYWIEL